MSYTQIYYHIVFSTKNRAEVLRQEHEKELYNYLWAILKKHNCHAYRIGGVEDHIHIFTSLHPTLALADLIRELKNSSTNWIHKKGLFPGFEGWQNEYGAFTKSHADHDMIINYIKNQKEHHHKETYIGEFKRLLTEDGVEFNECYLH